MLSKKYFLSILLLLAVCLPCLGQAGPTYFKPFQLSTHSTTNESFVFNDGSTFNGIKHVSRNGNVVTSVSYAGTITYPNGDRLVSFEMSGYDQYCRPINGFFLHLDSNGNATQLKYVNGSITSSISLDKSQYNLHDNIVTKVQTYSGSGGYYGGGYSGGGYSGGGSSSGSSSKALCRGCNGSGQCQHCGGRGYISTGSKCSLCHGTGRCQSCAGLGYVH